MNPQKVLETILSGRSDANIDFNDLCGLLRRLGFQERIRGSHHILYRDGIPEMVNLQAQGSKAKPYQVKQVRNIILKYHLGGEDE